MKFKYRDEKLARRALDSIARYDVDLKFMHVCGTHQDTLVRFGLEGMLEDVGVRIQQGPGCPVCVTTGNEIAEAIALARAGRVVTVFGDMLNVPTTIGSLADAKAEGGDVRIVYSVEDAVRMARQGEEVTFIAVGFETTSPTTASALLDDPPEGFSVLSCHRVIPPALDAIFDMGEVRVDGLIQPGHVCVITGLDPFYRFSEVNGVPQVVAGFEPMDILMAVLMLVKQVKEGRAELENEYSRLVRPEGNPTARDMIERVFEPVDRAWRGFPVLKGSALEMRGEFDAHNARKVHSDVLGEMEPIDEELKGCRCGEVLRGLIRSEECPLFGKGCNPKRPMGPCMVSREGNCNIAYRYGGSI